MNLVNCLAVAKKAASYINLCDIAWQEVRRSSKEAEKNECCDNHERVGVGEGLPSGDPCE